MFFKRGAKDSLHQLIVQKLLASPSFHSIVQILQTKSINPSSSLFNSTPVNSLQHFLQEFKRELGESWAILIRRRK